MRLQDLRKKQKLVLYIVAVNIYWYVSLFPARIGADAAGILQIIRNGNSTDWWSGSFYWFVKATSINGQFPQFTSLTQLLIFSFSISFFVEALPISQQIRRISLAVFVTLPIYGFFAMSISHDVTQTSGILLLVALNLRILNKKFTKNRPTIIILGFLLLTTTHTGLVIILLVITIEYLRGFRKLALLFFIFTILFYALTSVGLTSGLVVHGVYKKTSDVKYWSMLAGLKCVAQHNEADISENEWRILGKISNVENWKKPVSCQNYDFQIDALDLHVNNYRFDSFEFVKTYLSIAEKNPAIIAMSHIQRARGVLPPLLFQPPSNQVDLNVENPVGLGTNTALQNGPELLHPSNDLPELSSANALFPAKYLMLPAQGMAFLFNQASWFWGWGGLWFVVSIIVLSKQMNQLRIRDIILALHPVLVMHLLLVLLIPTSAPRYYMFSIILGIILLITHFVEAILNRKVNSEEK